MNLRSFEIKEIAFPSRPLYIGSGAKASSSGRPIRENRLIRLLVLSLFIHLGLLIAAFVFFMDTSGSGAGQYIVMVEISGLMEGGGAGGAVSPIEPTSLKQARRASLIKKRAAPAMEVPEKEGSHLLKKASPPVRAAKDTRGRKEIKALPHPAKTVHYAKTAEAAGGEGRTPDKSKALLEALPLARQAASAPALEGTNLLSVEFNPSEGARTPAIVTGEVSAVSYAALPGLQGGKGIPGARVAGGHGGRGRGVVIEGLKTPDYPAFSRLRGEDGTVKLQVKVGADGSRSEIKVLSSSGHARLDRAALRALERARFIPAMSNGRPAASTKTVVFVFKLKG